MTLPVNRKKFLIDTDAAADDMLALLLALNCNQITIEAITVVSGACAARQGVQNVAHLLERVGVSIPIHTGRQAPLLGPLRDSTHIMGSDGVGGFNFPHVDKPCDNDPACDVIRNFIRENPKDNTLVCLGPLTNLALALLSEPELVPLIGRLVIMGGVSDGVGNITPAAEFNIWADPEAARAVFESGVRCELIGWDVSRHDDCNFSSEDLQAIRDIGTPTAFYATDILRGLRAFLKEQVGTERVDLPDPIAMAIALNRNVATAWKSKHVAIDDSYGPSRGSVIVDELGTRRIPPNADIATSVNKALVLDMLKAAVLI